METRPKFLQGTFNFRGEGLDSPVLLQDLSYVVPANSTGQVIYFRAGNSADGLINLTLLRDGTTMRLFPLGIKSSMHFPLAIQETLPAGTQLELSLTAEKNLAGSVFVDIGLMEHLGIKPAA